MKTKRKHPSDYPQMAFRVSQEDKDRIIELVEQVERKANRSRDLEDYMIRKNDVIADALLLGLKIMKAKGYSSQRKI